MRTWASIVVAVLLLGACAAESDESTPAAQPATAEPAGFGAEEVGFGEAMGQIRGHHDAATQLYDGGDSDPALVHAGHPIDEILASVAGELEAHAPEVGTELAASLGEVRTLIEEGAGKQEVATATQEAADVTFDAQSSVAGVATEDPAYIGSIVGALLATSAHEYEEAVAGGEGVSLLEEYQDGYAFLHEAKDLYEEIVDEVEAASEEEAQEIEEAFDELDAAFPDLEAPEEPVPAESVEEAAELIAHELEETVGALPLGSVDPEEVAESIERLLDETVEVYAAGDAAVAGELAAEAYLENYEVIEAQVIENAPEINEELEPLLGADLRKAMSEGADVADIESMVARAKELLADAIESLEEGH